VCVFIGELESDASVQPIGEYLCLVCDLSLSVFDPKLVLTWKTKTFSRDSTYGHVGRRILTPFCLSTAAAASSTSSSFPLLLFLFLSLALPIFFFCPSLPFLPE